MPVSRGTGGGLGSFVAEPETEPPKAMGERPESAAELPKAAAELPKAAAEQPKAAAELPIAAAELPKADAGDSAPLLSGRPPCACRVDIPVVGVGGAAHASCCRRHSATNAAISPAPSFAGNAACVLSARSL